MKPIVEKVLEELDSIFKGRDRTLEVLLGLWLESILQDRCEGLAEADTLPKLCDKWLVWRAEEKVKALNKIVGIEDEDKAPVKLSAEAMQHLESLGLLRSDLPERIAEDEVLGFDDWEAGRFIADRLASEGNNIEALASLAKERIRRLGGSQKDFARIDDYLHKAKIDEVWAYPTGKTIWLLMNYAEMRVTTNKYQSHKPGDDLLNLDLNFAALEFERYVRIIAIERDFLDKNCETACRLRKKLSRKKHLDAIETQLLLNAEKVRDNLQAKFDRYWLNLNRRLGTEKERSGTEK